MKTPPYIQKNKKSLILIALIVALKSVIQLFEFPPSISLNLLRIGILLTAIVISLIIIKKWKFKLLTIALIILFSMGQEQLSLWKIPARNYVAELTKQNDKAITLILQKDSVLRVYKRPTDGLIIENIDHQTDSTQYSKKELEIINTFLTTTKVIEIEKSDFGVLLTMRRFIDNGYGLFYSTEDQFEVIENKDSFRINGLDVTGLTKLDGNWYYLSFT